MNCVEEEEEEKEEEEEEEEEEDGFGTFVKLFRTSRHVVRHENTRR